MNATNNSFSRPAICEFCQTSYGLSLADQRSLIVLVVLAGVALLLCYVSVLWYAIRNRFISDDKLSIEMEDMNTNEAFNDKEEQDEDIETNILNTAGIATPRSALFIIEEHKEQF